MHKSYMVVHYSSSHTHTPFICPHSHFLTNFSTRIFCFSLCSPHLLIPLTLCVCVSVWQRRCRGTVKRRCVGGVRVCVCGCDARTAWCRKRLTEGETQSSKWRRSAPRRPCRLMPRGGGLDRMMEGGIR